MCGILLSCCVVVAVCADENFFISKKIKEKKETKNRKIGKFQPTHNKFFLEFLFNENCYQRGAKYLKTVINRQNYFGKLNRFFKQ